MSLSEKTTIDKIEILETGQIQIRQATIIEKDGVELTRTFHRHVLNPGDDLSSEDPKVVAVAAAVWTTEVVEAWQALIEEQKNKLQQMIPESN